MEWLIKAGAEAASSRGFCVCVGSTLRAVFRRQGRWEKFLIEWQGVKYAQRQAIRGFQGNMTTVLRESVGVIRMAKTTRLPKKSRGGATR